MSQQQHEFNSSFERSEQLKHEWAELRSEIQSIHADDPSQACRRQNIHLRMEEIMQEMTQVLTHTRRLFPAFPDQRCPQQQRAPHAQSPISDTGSDDDPACPPLASKSPPDPASQQRADRSAHVEALTPSSLPLDAASTHDRSIATTGTGAAHVHYSARRKHVVRRTYDSTSSSGTDDTDGDEDSKELRRQMMHGLTTEAIITVEHKGHRANLATITRGIRNKLRSATSPSNPSLPNPSLPNPSSANIPSSSTSMSTAESLNSDAAPTATSASKVATPGDSDDIGTPSSAPAAPTPPGSLPDENDDNFDDLSVPTVLMNDGQREALSLEQAKLERESRRLKRKPDRTPVDETRLLDIASRLSKLSSTLAEAADGHEGSLRGRALMSPKAAVSVIPLSRLEKNREMLVSTSHTPSGRQTPGASHSNPSKKFSSNIFGGRSVRGQTAMSPVTADDDDDDDVGIDGTEEEQSPATGMKAAGSKTISKRKKTWMAFEAGMAPLKALGRSVRNTALPPAGSAKTPTRGRRATTSLGMTSSSSMKTQDLSRTQNKPSSSAYNELSSRVAERGEKLAGAAEASEGMASDASDMLSAARALRQRQQKGFRS